MYVYYVIGLRLGGGDGGGGGDGDGDGDDDGDDVFVNATCSALRWEKI